MCSATESSSTLRYLLHIQQLLCQSRVGPPSTLPHQNQQRAEGTNDHHLECQTKRRTRRLTMENGSCYRARLFSIATTAIHGNPIRIRLAVIAECHLMGPLIIHNPTVVTISREKSQLLLSKSSSQTSALARSEADRIGIVSIPIPHSKCRSQVTTNGNARRSSLGFELSRNIVRISMHEKGVSVRGDNEGRYHWRSPVTVLLILRLGFIHSRIICE